MRRRSNFLVPILALLAWALLAAAAAAQLPVPAAPPATQAAGAEPAAEEVVATDSPRAAMARFLELSRKGEFAAAGQYLETPWAQRHRRADLARKIKAVLDRHDWLDPESLSPDARGDRSDSLGPGVDRIGKIPGRRGKEEPVYIVRRAGTDEGWIFSAGTVRRIDGWYGRLENRWALEYLPEPLLRPGPRELLWWQWLALPLLVVAAWGAGMLLGWLTRKGIGRITARTDTPWDDLALVRLRGPVTLAWALGAAYLLVPLLALYEPAEIFVNRGLRTGFFLTLFWMLLIVADLTGQIIETWPWAKQNAASRSLILLGVRVAKVAVIAMAAIAVLSEFGYPVASLVAGLGIGGLAIALASQKTVEHMFGAVSLGVDQPFRVGDYVKIEEFEATVEAIGLRSTRFRTPDRTLIAIPNGKLAEMRLESLTARDRIRLHCQLGLEYGTTAAQMRAVLEGLERVLRLHPRIWPDEVVVRFKALGESALIVEVSAWFGVEWPEFTSIRQELLLAFMEVVEQAGTGFAFPTRTVHVVGQPAQVK